MRDNGTNYSSQIARGKGDHQLSLCGVLLLGFGIKDMSIEEGHNFFKENKLGHSIWYLSAP